MPSLMRWVRRCVVIAGGALSIGGVVCAALVSRILARENGWPVDGLEVIGATLGVSWIALSLSVIVGARPESRLRERWQGGLQYVGLGSVALMSALWVGHAVWVIDGSRHLDVERTSELLLRQIVNENTQTGAWTLAVSVDNRDIGPVLAADLIAAHPGLSIESANAHKINDLNEGAASLPADVLRINGYSYPAWRVVQVSFMRNWCWGAVDYIYIWGRWVRMGRSIGGGCLS